MKTLKLLPILLLITLFSQAQTLKIETAEKLFVQNSSQFLLTLKNDGFSSLSDDDVIDEEFITASNSSSTSTKDRLYTNKGLKKVYELRKVHYGGLCKLTINMNEPSCKTVKRLIWNANLSYDTRSYINELEKLDYKREEGIAEKYLNKEKGFSIIIKISQRTNELYFLMNKLV